EPRPSSRIPAPCAHRRPHCVDVAARAGANECPGLARRAQEAKRVPRPSIPAPPHTGTRRRRQATPGNRQTKQSPEFLPPFMTGLLEKVASAGSQEPLKKAEAHLVVERARRLADHLGSHPRDEVAERLPIQVRRNAEQRSQA